MAFLDFQVFSLSCFLNLARMGLTRAYGNTAKQVIEAAQIDAYIEWAKLALTVDYKQMQPLEYWLKKLNGKIVKQEFAGQVRVEIQLHAEQVETLLQSFPEGMDYLTVSKRSL
ncbi:MAG: DUF1949 domain-containing protein [Methylococcales bacterium]|nr:DUF1949 domain-containing protein [Methylococcales bacterium]